MRDTQETARHESLAGAETQNFVRRVVTTIKPRLTVETCADAGFTLPLLQGLNDNGFGELIVCDGDAEKCAALKKEIAGFDVSSSISVELRNQSALKSKFDGTIDLLVCADDHEQVVRYLLPQISPFGILLLHARESEHKFMRDFLLGMQKEANISVVLLPEHLRLAMAQKRSGRK